MDMKTLAAVLAAVTLVEAVVLYLLYRLFPQIPSTRNWAIGGACMAAGSVLFVLRGIVPLFMSIVIANGLYLLCYMFMLHGCRQWLKRDIPWRMSLSFLFIIWTPFFFLAYSHDYLAERIFLASLGMAVFSYWAGHELWIRNKNSNYSEKLAGFFFLFFGVIFFLRTIHVVFVEAEVPEFMQSTNIRDTLAYLTGIVGHVGYTAGFVLMISTRLQNEVKAQLVTLFEANSKTDKAIQEQRNLLTMISHEFSNPLATIKSTGDLIMLQAQDAPELKDQVGRVLRSTNRLVRLVDNVLKKDWMNKELENPAEQEIDATKLLTQTCQEFEVTLVNDHYDSIFVLANKEMLSLVFSNLISNAKKYAKDPQTVTVECSVAPTGQLIVCVEDDGPGVAREEEERIFEKYYRGSTVSEKNGEGVGLFFVKEIVERYHGKTELIQEGMTTFKVTLPCIPEGAP
ncbi:putative Signal transduction histidine kinase [Candidatus Terasakiella magnetica]|uniref:histidine kinase n=1 Tax=Candidatus Terasakiella magnetica TaxID=1867952 RepID=A0A1C3RFJ6_9PROT|nr:HAMP domain-containing sensor histidine kinase [Candidatus Terasakiella magnetica]SCA55992.1 putative Signal transduction histidine kinase [Candidatus Terasakiella magnetica]